LFNLFLEANQIVVVEKLHALAFTDIATSQEILKRQIQLITSSQSSFFSSGSELNNLPFESADPAGARRVSPLKVIHYQTSVRKQERRRAYCRNRSARIKSSPFKCGPLAIEPQSFNSPSSVFTDGTFASSVSENPFLLLDFPDSNTENDADSDIDSVSTPEKVILGTFHSQASKCFPQQTSQIVINDISIPAWPTHYSKVYNLF